MMPKAASAKKKSRRAAAPARSNPTSPKLAIVPAAAAEKRVRGIKLKTVSTWTMIFALLGLGALMVWN